MGRARPFDPQSGSGTVKEGPNAHQTVISGLDNQEIASQSSTVSDVWEGELSHSGMRITFKELEYLVRNRSNKSEKLPILRCISGFYLPAEMSAVMGPSGSGNTVLISPCFLYPQIISLSHLGVSAPPAKPALLDPSLCFCLQGMCLNASYNMSAQISCSFIQGLQSWCKEWRCCALGEIVAHCILPPL